MEEYRDGPRAVSDTYQTGSFTMALDSYVTLGRSGLRVSPLTLGTMTFGEDLGWGSSPEESEKILATYLDRGGNSIDTANIYTNGHAGRGDPPRAG